MSAKNPSLIAAEDAGDYQPWTLPGFDDGQVLPSAEKEARDRRQQGAVEEPTEEIIEEVDGEGMAFSPLTADELQAITDEAEREGREKGHADGLASGHAEGFERGFQEGLQKASEDSARKLAEQIAQLQQIAQSLVAPMEQQQQEIERVVVDFVCALTRQVVKRELLTDSSDIVATVQKALSALPVGADDITLYLNPDDLALVETYAEEQHKSWKFIGDNQLLPGGCKIQATSSLVDYSVETQLQELLEQFVNKQLASGDTDIDNAIVDASDSQSNADPDSTDSAP